MSSNLNVETTTRPTPTGLLSLPLELHEKIFRCIYEPNPAVLDDPAAAEVPNEDISQLLYPLMLVCKLLNERTVGLLYESINISTSRRTRLLRRTVTLNPSMGKLVKRLSFSLRNIPDPNHDAFAMSSMTRLLNHLVNLTSLSTEDTDSTNTFLAADSIREARCFGPQFSELSIKPYSRNNISHDGSILSPSFYFKYPLKHLSLDRCIPLPHECDFDDGLSRSAPPALQSLVLTNSFIKSYHLKRLLQNSLVSLKTLVFDMHSDTSPDRMDAFATQLSKYGTAYLAKDPGLVAVMESISPALERLELYWHESLEFPLSAVVSRFPNLRRLGWGGPLSGSPVLANLPSKLEELVIERCPAVTPERIVALLDGGTSSLHPHAVREPRNFKLKEIEVGPGMGWTDAGWESVRAACRREGVLVGYARTHAGLKPEPRPTAVKV